MAKAPAPAAEPAAAEKKSDVLEIRIATHDYAGQDDDELTFAKGDTIEVIPFPDPDDQVSRWSDGVAHVFPRREDPVAHAWPARV